MSSAGIRGRQEQLPSGHAADVVDASTDGFRPALILECELTDPLPRIHPSTSPQGGMRQRAVVLVRLATEPIGSISVMMPSAGIGPVELAAIIEQKLGDEIRVRYRAAGLPGPNRFDGRPVTVPASWPFLAERAAVLASAPPVSVILCTRDRPSDAIACLTSLRQLTYPNFEIIVVDNASRDTSTWDAVRELAGEDDRIRCIREVRPGLSYARNAGIRAAGGDILAFLDDDETADAYWLTELVEGFRSPGPPVGCVGGLVLPSALDTPAQDWFEQFGGHSKGRGFAAAVFNIQQPSAQSALFPLPPFAVGASVAFSRRALEQIGGFDPALGAGSPGRACEDTAAFTDVLLSGRSVVYRPSAILWHCHRPDLESLCSQLYGYGVGLTAFYTRLVLTRPRLIPAIIRLVPAAFREVLGEGATRRASMRDFPRQADAAHRRGMLFGPVAYLRGRRRARKYAHVRAKSHNAAPA
jgi:glycosyltransferase involved in cell wall biosynthesis